MAKRQNYGGSRFVVIPIDTTSKYSPPTAGTEAGLIGVALVGPDGSVYDSTTPLPVSTVVAAAATGTQSNVSGATSSTTLLAANTARRGATIWNDSTSILYVLLSSQTASATLCTTKLIADAYYEVPFGYTGIVKGIWVSATGSARITEIT